jgi:hypothetical protein
MPPVSQPLDFAQSDEEIWTLTQSMVNATPGHMNRDDWRVQLQSRLGEAGKLEERAGSSGRAGSVSGQRQ